MRSALYTTQFYSTSVLYVVDSLENILKRSLSYILQFSRKLWPSSTTLSHGPSRSVRGVLGLLYLPRSISNGRELARSLVKAILYLDSLTWYKSGSIACRYLKSRYPLKTALSSPLCNNSDHICWKQFVHDDVIKWKHFPRYWPFVRGIHRSPVNSSHKCQWRGALTFSVIGVRINGWVNNREAGDLRRYRAHYDVNVMVREISEESSTTLLFQCEEPCYRDLSNSPKIILHTAFGMNPNRTT